MAKSGPRFRQTTETAKWCWRALRRPASITTALRNGSRTRAQLHSSSHGPNSSPVFGPKGQRCSARLSGRARSTPVTVPERRRSMNVPPLRQRPAWALLQLHYQTMKDLHLRQLFAQEPNRGERLSAEAAGIYLDYSKNRVNAETLQLLLQLATESDLGGRIEAMFQGEAINVSQKREVLHAAL